MLRYGGEYEVTLLNRNLNEYSRMVTRKSAGSDSRFGLYKVILRLGIGTFEYEGQYPLTLIVGKVELPYKRNDQNDNG